MKEIRVFGHATVTVSTVIKIRDNTELTEPEIFAKAKKKFSGIQAFYGNGGDDKVIGVTGSEDTIAADEEVIFDDYFEPHSTLN